MNDSPDTADDFQDNTQVDVFLESDDAYTDAALAPLPTATSDTERPQAGLSRATIKRVIDKFVELESASTQHRALIAATLGCKADAAEITALVMSANRTNLDALTQVVTLAEAAASNPFEAVIRASALDRDDQKRVWGVLTLLGAATGGLPAKEMTAATRLAESAGALTPAQTADIGAVRALGKK